MLTLQDLVFFFYRFDHWELLPSDSELQIFRKDQFLAVQFLVLYLLVARFV